MGLTGEKGITEFLYRKLSWMEREGKAAMQENSSNFGYDVFISYATENTKITGALCHYLEEQKIRCWIAPRDILPGQDYAEAIVQAIKRVKIFVLVCSSSSLQSQYVRKETNLAVSDEKIIIPFRIDRSSLDGTPMELYLSDRHWIDAVPKPEEAFGDLAAAIVAFLGNRTQYIDDHKPVLPVQPNTKIQYEIDGTFFTKEQILKIAKFQPWLSFSIPLSINMFLIVVFISKSNIFNNISSLGERIIVAIIGLGGLFFYIVFPTILFVRSRFLQKSNFFSTIALVPLVLFSSLLCIGGIFLFYEIQHLKNILYAAGLNPSFWGVSKYEIAKFVNDSLAPEPVFSAQPSAKTQYEFNGIFFTKEQILKIAKFQPWLSFSIPVHINISVILFLVSKTDMVKNDPSSKVLLIVLLILSLCGFFIWFFGPSILFVRSRFLQKSNRVMTMVFVPFVFLCSFLCLSNIFLFYEIQNLRNILHSAGLETSFWGASKSEIAKFANDSLP